MLFVRQSLGVPAGVLLDASFDEFTVQIATAAGSGKGTDDKVFLKLFDAKGSSNITMRPGADDNLTNPIGHWNNNGAAVSMKRGMVRMVDDL